MNAPFHDQGRSKEGKLGGEIALVRQMQIENSSVGRNTNTNCELYSHLWDEHKYKTNYYTQKYRYKYKNKLIVTLTPARQYQSNHP